MAKATNAFSKAPPADPDGYTFRYAATTKNTALAGCKVIVSAYDNPGNETTQQKTL